MDSRAKNTFSKSTLYAFIKKISPVLQIKQKKYKQCVSLFLFQLTAIRTMLKEGLVDVNEEAPWSQLTPSMLQYMHSNALLGLL